MVAVVKPEPGEMVQDPAAGTCGFLIAADRYVKSKTDENFTLPKAQQEFQRKQAFYGVELVPDAHRLALMNAMLHGIEGDWKLGDTLSPLGEGLPKADVVLTNPPFGTKKGGGKPTRDDLTFETSNKQLAFVQHVVRALTPGGRAAVVVPDNVLFEENTGTLVRQDLTDKCDLHTVLRLPTGIFYAPGVKTNVLFFTRGEKDKANTKAVWVFDMRMNMPSFGKRTPFTREHFAEFEKAFGSGPVRQEQAEGPGRGGGGSGGSRGRRSEQRGTTSISAWLKDESAQRADDLRGAGGDRGGDRGEVADSHGGDGGAAGGAGRRGMSENCRHCWATYSLGNGPPFLTSRLGCSL